MKISDLIEELEDFRHVYGDLQVMACKPGIVRDGDTTVRERDLQAIVLVKRVNLPGTFTPICVVRA